jgi:hypothetical protein
VKEDSSFKKYNEGKTEKKKKFYRQKKNLYTNEDNNSSDDSDSETNEILFMGLETQTDGNIVSTEEDNPDKEAEVDFEAEFFSAIEEIDRLEERNRKKKKELQKYKEKEYDVEEIEKTIITLKVQIEEGKKIEEVLKSQLKERENICNSLESEIVYLRRELERSSTNIKYEKSSTTLNEILNHQRSPFDKTGLGYNKGKETANEEASTSSKQSNEERTKKYVDSLRSFIKVEDNRKEELYVPQKTNSPHKDGIWKIVPSRWNHTTRYQNSFFGYCYSCNGFGHKAIDCRTNVRSDPIRNNNRDTHGYSRRNYNYFSPLLNYNIICYNCNNFGHIEKLCRSNFKKIQGKEGPTIMKRNQEQSKDKSMFVQATLHAQKSKISGLLTVGALVT